MREGKKAHDWLPASTGPADSARAAPQPESDDVSSWVTEERSLRARRLSRELSDWVTELRARSAALESRMRDAEDTR